MRLLRDGGAAHASRTAEPKMRQLAPASLAPGSASDGKGVNSAMLPRPRQSSQRRGDPRTSAAADVSVRHWEVVTLMDGLVLLVSASKSPALRRVADDIYRHYGGIEHWGPSSHRAQDGDRMILGAEPPPSGAERESGHSAAPSGSSDDATSASAEGAGRRADTLASAYRAR